MANKRVLTAENVKDSCAKRRKISRDNNITSPLPQVDGLTDNADEKIFRFAPNITQTMNISHSSYASIDHTNTFLNGHFAPKLSLDGRHFMPPNHFGSYMPEFGLQQRLTRMSSIDNSSKDFNELSLQAMTQAPDIFKRSTEQGFINPANGAFPRMIHPNHLGAVDHKILPKNSDLPSSVNEFNAVGGHMPMPNGPNYYNSFLDRRKEYADMLNRPEMLNPQNPIMFSDYKNYHPSFNNGMKSFPINHFPYFRLPNIPDGSNFQDSFSQSKPFSPFLPLMPNNQIFSSRPYVPLPNSTHHWNTGLEKKEFPRAELPPDTINTLPKTEYLTHKNNSNVPLLGSSSNPMKMIENFSATHFHNSFPNNSTIKSEEKIYRINHEKSSAKIQQTSSEVQDEQRGHGPPMMETGTKHFPTTSEKRTKRSKKNGEQLKYESWLYEKRNALQSRLMMLEQEMLSIPSSGSCQELRGHFESAIGQLRKEGLEHEAMIKVFESTNNLGAKNDGSTPSIQDKPTRPAKCNGVSQHLDSNVVPSHPGVKNQTRPSALYQNKGTDETEPPTNTCKQINHQRNFEDLPLPKIVEPFITVQCTAGIKGWPSEIEKPKLVNLKQDIDDGFKPTDALKILNKLPEDNISKVLRMEDLSRRLLVDGSFEVGPDNPENCSGDHKEFRISSESLVMNKQCFAMMESCSQCCRIMRRPVFVEEIVVAMGREKVLHGLKFCGENCMKAHQEKRKIWERDKKLHEDFMEKNVDNRKGKDLNNTIIYDPNKTLPLDTSKESLQGMPDQISSPIKRWRDVKYGTWCKLCHSKKRQKKETVEDGKKDSHLFNYVHAPAEVTDTRSCFLCSGMGDDEGNGPGRLLMVDIDKWGHANCSLWSSNIYEALDGTFIGSKSLRGYACARCNEDGATITCFLPNCGLKFHLRCALSIGVCFLENKVTYCRHHCPKNMLGLMVKDISIRRRVCIERQESQQIAKMLREDEPENFAMRLGNLIVNSIGHLLPQFVHGLKFNTTENIYPVGFRSVRFYWSYRKLHQRCRYICSILERNGEPVFRIEVEEEDGEEEEEAAFENNNCTGVWMQVISRLDGLRRSSGLSRVFTEYISGEDLFGLNEPAVRRIIESLPGVELLSNCNLKYGKSSIYIPPLAPNPSGCIRSEPKSRTLFKRSHTLLSNFNAGSTAKSAWLGSGEFSITQYMKQFTATKSQRYRSLKTEWRNNVYLRRSNIQGLGLFAGRELEQFTMVIEYIGELIRNEISEIREKIYEQQNRGVYMFRLDENTVIDATMTGGPARYINHCCDPNCFTEVIPTEKGNKIVIIAKRKIHSGEELSYDYKFNLEDEKSKIPCLCGAENCFKWMN